MSIRLLDSITHGARMARIIVIVGAAMLLPQFRKLGALESAFEIGRRVGPRRSAPPSLPL